METNKQQLPLCFSLPHYINHLPLCIETRKVAIVMSLLKSESIARLKRDDRRQLLLRLQVTLFCSDHRANAIGKDRQRSTRDHFCSDRKGESKYNRFHSRAKPSLILNSA